MTSSAALANEGLFEMTQHPSLTQAVLLSFAAETSKEPGRQPASLVVSANYYEMARVNEGLRVSSRSPSLARAFEEVMSKETDET